MERQVFAHQITIPASPINELRVLTPAAWHSDVEKVKRIYSKEKTFVFLVHLRTKGRERPNQREPQKGTRQGKEKKHLKEVEGVVIKLMDPKHTRYDNDDPAGLKNFEIEARYLALFQRLVERRVTPHIPRMLGSCILTPDQIVSLFADQAGIPDCSLFAIVAEAADLTFYRLLVENDVQHRVVVAILLQILLVLDTLLTLFPSFRHNDLHASNVLLRRREEEEEDDNEEEVKTGEGGEEEAKTGEEEEEEAKKEGEGEGEEDQLSEEELERLLNAALQGSKPLRLAASTRRRRRRRRRRQRRRMVCYELGEGGDGPQRFYVDVDECPWQPLLWDLFYASISAEDAARRGVVGTVATRNRDLRYIVVGQQEIDVANRREPNAFADVHKVCDSLRFTLERPGARTKCSPELGAFLRFVVPDEIRYIGRRPTSDSKLSSAKCIATQRTSPRALLLQHTLFDSFRRPPSSADWEVVETYRFDPDVFR